MQDSIAANEWFELRFLYYRLFEYHKRLRKNIHQILISGSLVFYNQHSHISMQF